MIISGLQKTTLVDYPGKVAATVFTRGCSFRCPFCHNPELVIPEKFLPEMPMAELREFFVKRQGKLEGVCITGGEPLLFSDTKDFLAELKNLGYAVKLDSNGSFPDRLEEIISLGLADYIAMDIKAPLAQYAKVSKFKAHPPAGGSNPKIEELISRSIGLIMDSGIDYEFRTTICKPLHSVESFRGMGELIKGAKRYYIQNFVHSKHNDETLPMQAFSDEELEQGRLIMQEYVNEAFVR